MIEDGSALADVREAIQKFAQAKAEVPVMIDVAIVLWEQMSVDDNGVVGRSVHYAIPTDNFGLSSALGLLQVGRYYMTRDLFKEPDV